METSSADTASSQTTNSGLAAQRSGDTDTLSLSAGKLMGKTKGLFRKKTALLHNSLHLLFQPLFWMTPAYAAASPFSRSDRIRSSADPERNKDPENYLHFFSAAYASHRLSPCTSTPSMRTCPSVAGVGRESLHGPPWISRSRILPQARGLFPFVW